MAVETYAVLRDPGHTAAAENQAMKPMAQPSGPVVEGVVASAILLDVARITVSHRLRPVNPRIVEGLVSSIREVGLVNPVTVVQVNGGYKIVSGVHRLEAFRRLGRRGIPARVVSLDDLRLRLIEIDENLVRANLTALEEAHHLAERKQVYLALHPETGQGQAPGAGRGKKPSQKTPDSGVFLIPTFVEDTAQKTGAGQSTVYQKVQVGEALAPVVGRLRGTPVEDSQQDLLTLARLATDDPGTFARAVETIATNRVPMIEALRRIRHKDRPHLALPKGEFRVIYADPPWSYSDQRIGLGKRATTAAAHHYPTLTTDELCDLDVRSLAHKDSVLFCWATFPLLPDALKVVEAWGFTYKTAFVWWKPRGSFGHYHKADAELLLLATRGSCTPDDETRPPQVFRAPAN